MKLKHLSALFAVCLMFLLISCTDSDSSSQKIISVTSDEAEASTGENTFAYNLFNTFVSSGSEKENIGCLTTKVRQSLFYTQNLKI